MACKPPRRFKTFRRRRGPGIPAPNGAPVSGPARSGSLNRAYQGFKLFPGDPPKAEQPGPFVRQIQYRGFHPDPGRPAVKDNIDLISKLIPDMFRPGGGEAAKKIGAGGGYGPGRQADKHLGYGMIRKADRRSGQAAGSQIRYFSLFRQDQGKGAGPKSPQLVQPLPRPGAQGGKIRRQFQVLRGGDVNDQGIETGPPLYLKDPGQGGGIEGVSPQAVDRFRRKGRQTPGADKLGGSPDISLLYGKETQIQAFF
jgi:hypothetical protein